jgi:hypothetical protein
MNKDNFIILDKNCIKQYKKQSEPFSNHELGKFIYNMYYCKMKFKNNKEKSEKWYETIERIINNIYNLRYKRFKNLNYLFDTNNEKEKAKEFYKLMFNGLLLPSDDNFIYFKENENIQNNENFLIIPSIDIYINKCKSYDDFRNCIKYALLYCKTLSNNEININLVGIINFIKNKNFGILAFKEWCLSGKNYLKHELYKISNEYQQNDNYNNVCNIIDLQKNNFLNLLPNTVMTVDYSLKTIEIPFNIKKENLDKIQKHFLKKNYKTSYNIINKEFSICLKYQNDIDIYDVSAWEQMEILNYIQILWSDNIFYKKIYYTEYERKFIKDIKIYYDIKKNNNIDVLNFTQLNKKYFINE